jgi:putative transposase
MPMTRTDHAGWRSRGYLPHLDVPYIIQHVVFRLADSLPASAHDSITAVSAEGRADAIDEALDHGLGARDLATPEVAELVQNALLHFDGDRYACWRGASCPTMSTR